MLTMNDLTNREFGDYHIIRRIGSGATADVFLAEQRSLGRRVALKILKQDLANDETHLRRFLREAKAIAALNHPGLIQIYQIDCHDNYWFIAQEYVQGETLQQKIQRLGALPIPHVVDVLWQISAAFETITGLGIVHRDIKPDNILLGSNGIVKATDFGLAHIKMTSSSHTDLALTEIGMTLGTPLYMSPEQAQGQPLDHRSDIYSLGITCWHALAGKPPFTGTTALSVALQQVNNSPPPLLKQRPDIPPSLAAIVERMIEKKPANRYQTFHSILQEMQTRGLVPDSVVLVRQSDSATETARQILQRALEQRRTRLGTIASLLLFVIAVAFLGWTLGYGYRTWLNPSFVGASTQVVPKMLTVDEQWIYACFVRTPDAWQAVIDYFPEETYLWGNKAKRQLIRHYYLIDDRHNSRPLFEEFSLLSDFDLEEQMLGLAGLTWCTAMDENTNIRIPQGYLEQIRLIHYFNPDDELYVQILDAATRKLRERGVASESPSSE